MSARKSSHRTIFLIVSSGSPLALIASSLRSTSKKPVCPMTRSFHPPMAHCNQRVRFAATWREEFFEVPSCPRLPSLDAKGWHEMDTTTEPRLDPRRREAHPERITVGNEVFVRNDIKAKELGESERSVNRGDRHGAPFLFIGGIK